MRINYILGVIQMAEVCTLMTVLVIIIVLWCNVNGDLVVVVSTSGRAWQ